MLLRRKKRERKVRKKEAAEPSRTKTAPLAKFEFHVHGACKILIFISSDLQYSKKNLYIVFSRTEESS